MKQSIAFFFISLLAYGQAQISNLAIHPTGNAVYFSTQLSPKGQSLPPGLRLFEFKDNRFTVINQTSVPGAFGSRFYLPLVQSLDGRVRAINYTLNCIGGSSCFNTANAYTLIQSNRETQEYASFASISPNGRFVALYNARSGFPIAIPGSPGGLADLNGIRLLDLATGQSTSIGKAPALSGQFVTDNGTTLIATSTGLQLIGPAQSKDLPLARTANHLLLSNEATRIVYETKEAPIEIRLIDISTGTDKPLFFGTAPSLALDGRTLSYINATKQIFIADLTSLATRPLSTESESIVEQAISSNGVTVAAITQTGRVLSINAATSQVTQLLDAPPQPVRLFTGMVPGSYNEIISNFPEDFVPDLKLNDQPAPILLGRTSKGFALQIPWEATPNAEVTLSLDIKDSPWQSSVVRGILPASGRILPIDDLSIAIHEDWSAPINANNPAKPGETVHLFGTGYGPVDGALESGKPTPTNRLFRMTADCTWRIFTGSRNIQPIEPEFAGLAPGLIGIYQFNFKIPTNWDIPFFNPYCEFPDTSFLPTGVIRVKLPQTLSP